MKRELLLSRTKRYDKMTREQLIEKCRALYEENWHLKIKVKWDDRKEKEKFNTTLEEDRRAKQASYMRKLRSQTDYQKKQAQKQKEYQRKIKDKLFEILGGKICIGCGEKDESVLHFDHINGGGLQDYKRFENHTDRMRAYYVKNPELAKETLQVMCSNCNWKKKHKNNENSYQY
jgi:hypothetical protein